MSSIEPVLRPGDIIATTGDGWLSRAIRWATRVRGESRTEVSHNGLVVQAGRTPDALIVEALLRVRCHTLRESYGRRPDHRVEVWSPINLSDEQRSAIAAAALARRGRPYPAWRLLYHLVDERLLGGRVVLRRLGRIGRRYRICTPLVAEAFWEAGLRFGESRPEELNPDSLRDFMLANPGKWRRIRDLRPVA